MVRQVYTTVIISLLMLAILAGGPRATSRGAEQSTAVPTSAEPAGASAATLTAGTGSFNLQPTAGLSDLSSYQVTLKIDFQGNTNGRSNPWTETLTLLANAKPSARVLTAAFKGNAPDSATVAPWSATVNGMFYWEDTDGACLGSAVQPSTAPASPLPVPQLASFLPGVFGAEESGAKSVNGVSAKGYKFDQQALGIGSSATASGEVWVADQGGYIVNYALTLKGGTGYFGEGGDGTLSWTYDVTNVGKPAAITLPKDCPLGSIDAPMMQDSQNVQELPGAIFYTTPSTLKQVADFYQKALPAAGWKLSGKPNIGKTGGTLSFKQGTSQLSVTIATGDSGTSVQLLLN